MKSTFNLALIALGAASALTLAASPAQAASAKRCAAQNVQGLDAQFAAFNAAWATKSPDKVTALFDDDAVLLPTVSNTPRTDHAGIRDYFVHFLKGNPAARIDSSTVKMGCNWAMRAGTWTVTLTDPATQAKREVKARYSFLYQFEDGKWRIEHLHSSAMPETGAPASH